MGRIKLEFYHVLVHEGTHAFLHRYVSEESMPLWVEEGLADYIAASLVDRAPNRMARFWIDRLEPNSVKRLHLSTEQVVEPMPEGAPAPEITFDDSGWPQAVRWPGMPRPLFDEGLGRFSAVRVEGFAPRWILADIRAQQGEARTKVRREHLIELSAEPDGSAVRAETPHSIVLTQRLRHARLAWARRVLEIWKTEPRARLTFSLNRLPSAAPEIFYLDFPLPTASALPTLSNGGVPFTPFSDQLGESCQDYFAVDGWADYATPGGHWLWVSRDVPLITFGSDCTLARRQGVPPDVHRLRAMLLNNFWYTNFLADEPGIMEFRFDLVWKQDAGTDLIHLAETLASDPVLLINPTAEEDPRVLRDLFQP